MSDWRERAIEAGAQAIVALDHYTEDEWQVFTPDAAAVLDAVAPIIRSDEQERIAKQWQTKDWPLLTKYFATGSVIGAAQAVTDWLREGAQ